MVDPTQPINLSGGDPATPAKIDLNKVTGSDLDPSLHLEALVPHLEPIIPPVIPFQALTARELGQLLTDLESIFDDMYSQTSVVEILDNQSLSTLDGFLEAHLPELSHALLKAIDIQEEDNPLPPLSLLSQPFDPKSVFNEEVFLDAHQYELAQALLAAKNISEAESIGEPVDKMADSLIGLTDKYGVSLIQGTLGPLDHIQAIANTISLDLTVGSLIFKAPESLGKGGLLIYKRIVLNRAYAALKEMKKAGNAANNSEISRVEKWLSVQENEIKEQAVLWGLNTVNLFPTAVKVGLTVSGHLSPIAGIGVGGAALVVSGAVQGVQLYHAGKESSEQAAWLKILRKDLKEEIEPLIAKRESLPNATEIHPYVTLRKQVAEAAIKKQENERKFFNFKIGTTAISFSVTALAGIAIITLKILAVAGVMALATSALAYTGVGIAALALGLMVAGIIFLFIYKPHLFKSLISGVQARLTLYSIPKNFAKFQATKRRAELSRITQTADAVKSRLSILEAKINLVSRVLPQNDPLIPLQEQAKIELSGHNPEAIRIELKALEKKWRDKEIETQKQLEALDKKVTSWKVRTKELQMRSLVANWKDLEKKMGPSITLEGLTSSIVEGLTSDSNQLDEATKNVLTKHLGLDLEKLKTKGERMPDKVKIALLKHFALSDKDMIHFIRQQRMRTI